MNRVAGRVMGGCGTREGLQQQGQEAVLVVEDCQPLLSFFDSALPTIWDGKRYMAATLAEAAALWEQHKDEITQVVLNYELPDGVAWTFAAELIEERPDLNVIVTSGYSIEEIRSDAADASRLMFLQKPFRLTELQEALRPHTVTLTSEFSKN